jgi:hydroxymethylglutaryl-CoA lyase
MLKGLGVDSGVDLEKLVEVGVGISQLLGRTYGSRAGTALAAKMGNKPHSVR